MRIYVAEEKGAK